MGVTDHPYVCGMTVSRASFGKIVRLCFDIETYGEISGAWCVSTMEAFAAAGLSAIVYVAAWCAAESVPRSIVPGQERRAPRNTRA